jgi:hypothetical protein
VQETVAVADTHLWPHLVSCFGHGVQLSFRNHGEVHIFYDLGFNWSY